MFLTNRCRSFTLSCVLFLVTQIVIAQDSTGINKNDTWTDSTMINVPQKRFGYKKLIVPAVFIGYGVASLGVKDIKQLNLSTKSEIDEHKPDHIRLDNYTQYMPALLIYGLNGIGIKGKHGFTDRSIIYASSQLISAGFVVPLKRLVKEERPDGSNKQSFPSGHTATAFSTAHFMFKEYKDNHFWLGMSGYSFAVFTGVYRALNDKHWVGDVVAGAGIGILSTELAYWLYPKMNNLFKRKKERSATMVMPFYQNKTVGLSFVSNIP